jgi:hypothetical protein
MRIDASTGNVGIGTTSPTDLLHIRKDQNAPTQIRVENASNTSNSRASITVGTAGNAITMARYLSNYTTVSSWANRGGILTDSGLTNGFFFRTSAGAISFQPGSNTDSVVFDTSGNVGIGTTNPTAELHVETSNQSHILSKSTGSSAVFTADGFANSAFAMKENGTLKSEFFYDSINNQMKIRTSSAESLSMGVNNGQNIFIQGSSGNVGIGTTSPLSWTTLHVEGIVHASNIITTDDKLRVRGASQADKVIIDGDGVSYFNGGNVGIGTTSPHATALLEVASTTKGVLFPRMTETQRDAIEEPATGLIVYQTDGTEGLYIYKSTGWTQII